MSEQEQQQQSSSSAGQGGVATLQTGGALVQDRLMTSCVWTVPRLCRRHHQATTAFDVVAHDIKDDAVSTAQRESDPESDQRSTKDDSNTGVELPTTGPACPGRRRETEWTRVAEVLDRFFFFVFMVLLLVPTVTILGFVRLFKPEL